jgi:hypothetical protein
MVCTIKKAFDFSVGYFSDVRKMEEMNLKIFISYFKLLMLKLNVHDYCKDYLNFMGLIDC